MKRLFSFALIAILFSPISKADEGMWLLHMLKQINEASMQDAGFRLTAEDIYDINNASLKDAILRLNGGSCTAEVISSEETKSAKVAGKLKNILNSKALF